MVDCLISNRWDLQRLREQKIYEKLKEKEMTAENLKKGEDQHVESFYPLLDDSELPWMLGHLVYFLMYRALKVLVIDAV